MKRYPFLDIFRLFLALEVVFLHAHLKVGLTFWIPFPPVPTFVALSGLLIPGSLRSSRNVSQFIWKRFLRVVPGMLVSFVLVWILFGAKALGPTAVVYLTISLIRPEGHANNSIWSLMLEEILYAIHVIFRRFWTPVSAAACCLITMVIWGLTHGSGPYDPSRWPDMHLCAVAAFFLGNVLSFYREKLKTFPIPWILIALAAAIAGAQIQHPMAVTICNPIVAGLAVCLAYAAPAWNFQIPDLSYGIYAYSTPILSWMIYRNHVPLEWALTAGLGVILGLAAVSWFFMESRALRLKDRPWKFSKTSPVSEPLEPAPSQV